MVGSHFWTGLLDWIKSTLMSEYGNINEVDLDLFSIVDTPEEVIEAIENFYKKYNLSPNF